MNHYTIPIFESLHDSNIGDPGKYFRKNYTMEKKPLLGVNYLKLEHLYFIDYGREWQLNNNLRKWDKNNKSITYHFVQ